MNKKQLILPGLLLVFVLAFSFVDFRAAWSQTRVEHQVSTASLGEGLPYLMRDASNLSVSVTGGQAFNSALQQKVLAALRSSGGHGEVVLLPDIVNNAGQPYLMVRVLEKRITWTPLYASARVVVEIGFGSNGNMTQILTDQPYTMDNKDGPSIFSSGEFTLTDTTIGLSSLPGYRSLLAKEFATRIGEMVNNLYQVK